MKRPDDYRPDNPAAAEGINHVRSFGADWPLKQKDEPPMITLDTLRAEVARGMYETAPKTRSEVGERPGRHGIVDFDDLPDEIKEPLWPLASAAIAIVLRAVAEHAEQAAEYAAQFDDDIDAEPDRAELMAVKVVMTEFAALVRNIAAGGGR